VSTVETPAQLWCVWTFIGRPVRSYCRVSTTCICVAPQFPQVEIVHFFLLFLMVSFLLLLQQSCSRSWEFESICGIDVLHALQNDKRCSLTLFRLNKSLDNAPPIQVTILQSLSIPPNQLLSGILTIGKDIYRIGQLLLRSPVLKSRVSDPVLCFVLHEFHQCFIFLCLVYNFVEEKRSRRSWSRCSCKSGE
jgi:hypothetical protein